MDTGTGWSRDLLYQLVDNVREYSIFATKPDGEIVSWNPGGEKIFGYTGDEIIGQKCDILFTPDDNAKNEPDRERSVARQKGWASDERWHMRKDGSRFFASGIMTPLVGENGELTGFAKICRDLTDRVNLQHQLEEHESSVEEKISERTKQLSEKNQQLHIEVVDRKQREEMRVDILRKIVRTQEDERKRIAREIHDHIGQQMTVMKLRLRALGTLCKDTPLAAKHIADLEAVANQIDADVDFLAWELRPSVLDDLGLAPAVDKFVDDWSRHFNIPAEFRLVDWNGTLLAPEIEINLYRIAQEALNNVCKHAEAKNASVILEQRDDLVRLIVEDDGRGFDVDSTFEVSGDDRGMGLLGMKERAELLGGNIEIESAPGRGTTVFARVPSRHENL